MLTGVHEAWFREGSKRTVPLLLLEAIIIGWVKRTIKTLEEYRQALKMYTMNGAYAGFEEKMKGSLENGKYTDMAMLSKDYFTCGEEEIPEIEPELTLVGGRIVYERRTHENC